MNGTNGGIDVKPVLSYAEKASRNFFVPVVIWLIVSAFQIGIFYSAVGEMQRRIERLENKVDQLQTIILEQHGGSTR